MFFALFMGEEHAMESGHVSDIGCDRGCDGGVFPIFAVFTRIKIVFGYKMCSGLFTF
jgi:hypothetical protein